MKSPLTRKLIRLFLAVLLLFALVVGGLFTQLGARNFRRAYEERLMERAVAIARSVSQFTSENTPSGGRMRMGGHMAGHARELRFIDDIAMNDVWLLNEQGQTIEVGHGKRAVTYNEFSEDAQKIVGDVFQGKQVLSRSFSSLLGDASITAAVPVRDDSGSITAALLVHERLSVADAFLLDAGKTFAVALGSAIVLVSGLAVAFARRFLRPLVRLGETTRTLAQGDYTARTELVRNDEIGELAEDLDALAVRLEEAQERDRIADATRRDFSAKLSHELRTPVTVLRGSLEALKDGVIQDPDTIRVYHETLYDESRQLERLIGDMLDLTALQNPHFPLDTAPLNLFAVVSDAVRSQRHAAAQKNLTVNISGPDQMPFIGDYGRLRQMFVTILHNAVKYADTGSVIRVDLSASPEESFVRIANVGPPIPHDALRRIFEAFHQTDASQEGFGLGLTIAKEIAQRHGLRLSATSTAEDGTAFFFYLPPQTPALS